MKRIFKGIGSLLIATFIFSMMSCNNSSGIDSYLDEVEPLMTEFMQAYQIGDREKMSQITEEFRKLEKKYAERGVSLQDMNNEQKLRFERMVKGSIVMPPSKNKR